VQDRSNLVPKTAFCGAIAAIITAFNRGKKLKVLREISAGRPEYYIQE
jgi:hypothetical protein